MTQTETDPDAGSFRLTIAGQLADDLAAANWQVYSTAGALAECLTALGWRKAADAAGPIQRDVEANALAYVRTCQVGREGSVRYGLRAAVAVADTMAMDATRGPCITKAQEQFAEAAKRVADSIWALRMRIEVTR